MAVKEVVMKPKRSRLSSVAAVLLLCVAACAHDRAFDRREVGAMKDASPVISPWAGPVADPIAANHN